MDIESILYRALILAFPLLLGLTVHECAHGLAAKRLGDPTAYMMGRLTLNPLPHLDLLGTVMLLFSGFIGWAKPVPVDPRYFKNPVRDMGLVALAGPFSNLFLSFLFGLSIRLMLALDPSPDSFMSVHLLLILVMGVVLNCGLAIFNLLPLPPLDGFRVAAMFMPRSWVDTALRYTMVWFVVLIVLAYLGFISRVVGPIIFKISFIFLPDDQVTRLLMAQVF